MARYRIARRAVTDLDAIWFFIAQHNPAAADRFLDRLYNAFVGLDHGIGHLVSLTTKHMHDSRERGLETR